MQLNGKHHHLTCLSGSSQSPLINTNGNFAKTNSNNSSNSNNTNSTSERGFKPHSINLFQRSPTQTTTKISASQLQQPNTPLILATPTTANNAQSSSLSSIFFPPVPARTSLQQHHFQSNLPNRSPRSAEMMNVAMTAAATAATCESHKSGSRDFINQSFQSQPQQQQQPASATTANQHHQQLLQTQQQRISNTALASTSHSSNLNSPNIMPAKSFSGFFAEPLFKSSTSLANHSQPPATRRSINQLIPSTFSSEIDRSQKQQPQEPLQDDTYHLYHEPIDPDDQEEEEKSPVQLSSQDNRFSSQGKLNGTSNGLFTSSQTSSPNSRRNDVSADIYFCYVTLKSNNNCRTNLRSRSYHGHKNNSINLQQAINQQQQASSSNSIAELTLSPIMDEIRQSCIDELITTEMNYTHALNIIITHYAKPLEPFLRRDENQLIFSHIKYFYNVHSTFQNDLVKNAPNVASCFLNARDKFLRYGEYCATLTKAQSVVEDLINKNETIAAQIERCHQDANEGKFKLSDLLSLPMQRILKYHLILGQLVKSTNSRHEDFDNLKRAHEAMLDLNKYINEAKRDTESMQIINDIEQAITGLNLQANTQLTDYGRLHFDGTIKVRLPHDHHEKTTDFAKVKQKRYSFVFDKVFLMCKMGYQYKEALLLSEFSLDPDPAPLQTSEQLPLMMTKSLIREKWSYNFNLIRRSDNSVYMFFTKDLERKNLWVDAIQKALDNLRPAACRLTNHDFLMHTFERGSSCDNCGKLFHGLCYQGYRCRTCFTSVHKDCISAMRSCGPTIKPLQQIVNSPKIRENILNNSSNNNLMVNPGFGKEPASPSIRSNCSDHSENNNNNTNFFPKFPHHSQNLGSKDGKNQNCELSANSYYNYIPSDHLWFCGRMERDKAQALLENMPNGTFLVRVSPKHNESYVISLNYNNQVKHMRIYVSKDNQFYLSQNRYFKSVVDLVSWYETNSLVESFHMLDARLAIPYKSN